MKKIFRSKWFWIGSVALIVLIIAIFGRGKGGAVPEFSSAKVEKKDLLQSVEETGSIKSELELYYGWEISGRVASIQKKVGAEVQAGDIIATVESSSGRNALAQANANLAAAQARLNQELVGPNEENRRKFAATVDQSRATLAQAEADLVRVKSEGQSAINTAEKNLESAKNNLRLASGGNQSEIVRNAYETLTNTLKSTHTTLSDALTQADNVLGVDNRFVNDDFENQLSNLNPNLLVVAKASYDRAKTAVRGIESALLLLTSDSQSTVDQKAKEIQGAVLLVQRLMSDVQSAVNATIPGNSFTQDELAALKTDVTTKHKNVNTASATLTTDIQAVTTAKNSLVSYQIAYDQAEQTLESTKIETAANTARYEANVNIQKALLAQAEASYADLIAPPRNVDIAALRAEVSRAASQVADAQVNLEKTFLRALANGTVAELEVELGENVVANTPVVKIISTALSLDVDISETEISKVSIQDVANMTLDAFDEDRVFTGHVAAIKPAQKEISGVVYYTTTIVFNTSTPTADIKPGMTANVQISTDKKEGVLVIPERAIVEKDGQKIVRILTDKKTATFREQVIQTGLRGDDGQIEVISGLEVDQEIITFIKESVK